MKDVLDLYAQPLDALHPVVCFDEQSVQLLADSRAALPIRPGTPRRQDHEYVRHGTRNLFMFVEPKAGQRHILVTQRRTKEDFAKAIRYLVDVVYPHVDYILLVLGNLNTHAIETLIEIYGKAEADRLISKLRFHYTPVHASWLNIAEIELSAMTRQTLDRRIPCEWTLTIELIAWEYERNRLAIPIKWSFERYLSIYNVLRHREIRVTILRDRRLHCPLPPLSQSAPSAPRGAGRCGWCGSPS